MNEKVYCKKCQLKHYRTGYHIERYCFEEGTIFDTKKLALEHQYKTGHMVTIRKIGT